MKKSNTVKKIVIMIVIVLVVLITMGFTDYRRTTHSFEKPIFAQITNGVDDGGSGLYVGIGYSIEIKGNFMPEDDFKGVTQATFYIFGNKINHTIKD